MVVYLINLHGKLHHLKTNKMTESLSLSQISY